MKKKSKEINSINFIGYENFLKKSTEPSLINKSLYLEKIKAMGVMLKSLPSVLYILDYQTKKYLYVSDNCEKITGYTTEQLLSGGNSFFISKIHPDDLKIYSNKIFGEIVNYTTSQDREKITNTRFSLNYRFKRGDNEYIHLLQQYEIVELNNEQLPLLAIGFATDISGHKSDNKVAYSISTFDKNKGFTKVISDSFTPIETKVSEREKEIIKELMSGKNSKEIATKLSISLYTVNAHRRNILIKTGCRTTAELISYSIVNGIG